MAYLASELVTRAYYLSSVVSRGFQVPTGDQLDDGMALLNSLLATKSMMKRMVPYYTEYSLTPEIGVETYFIPNLIDAEIFTFEVQTIRYSTQPLSRRMYFATSRANNINALPFSYHFERTKGGSNLSVYFKPDQEYPFKIWGKFGLESALPDDDLLEVYDAYYIEYMRYSLAELICMDNNILFLDQNKKQLLMYEKNLANLSPNDFTQIKYSAYKSYNGINYADINMGKGWRPTGIL